MVVKLASKHHGRRAALSTAAICLLAASACTGGSSPTQTPPQPARPPLNSAPVQAPVAKPATPEETPNVQVPARLKFSHDDYAAALVRAKSTHKLLFVDAWAPWCHTCLSMNSYVFNDQSLVEFARSYVFVSLDTDRAVNTTFLEKYVVDTWPTFFVIDPSTEQLIGYWTGSGSVREMREFLEQSKLTAATLRQSGNSKTALSELTLAQIAQSRGKLALALAHYERAYQEMPTAGERNSELLLGYIRVLLKRGQLQRCAEVGKQHLGKLSGAARPIQFAQRYFTCLDQEPRAPSREAGLERVLAHMVKLTDQPSPDMSFDDHWDALSILADAYKKLGRTELEKHTLERRLKLVDEAASGAESKEREHTYDYARAISYVDAGRGEEAIKFLLARISELPRSYEPVWRLSQVLFQLKRYPEALVRVDEAIAKSYGPRQLGFYERKAALHALLGDTREQVATLEAEVAARKKLARGHANKRALAGAIKRLKQAQAGR